MIDDIKSPKSPQTKTVPTQKKEPVPTPVTEWFKRGITVVDANVMPVIAWVAIAGLAVRGAQTLLTHMSSGIQITVAIAVVAFLAFKLR